MNFRLNAKVTLIAVLLFAKAASAHRLDEYLQATLISLDKDQIHASMRLIPGVAVSPAVIQGIDTNGDGFFSIDEKTVYANRVLADLSLTIDALSLKPKLVSTDFPPIDQLRTGLGEIHIEFFASLPKGNRNRRLILINHHQNQRSVYLVNSLVPIDADLQIEAQQRNEQQTVYQVDYVQSSIPFKTQIGLWTTVREAFDTASFLSLFRLGMRHIAQGSDHLLFLFALLLPGPLLVSNSRWAGYAGTRSSLLRILKIVTAFTIGHSISLSLAVWRLVAAPSRPVEVLIAVSILVSAIHALHPIFRGKEAGLAAFFGLIHGLAFATALTSLGLTPWQRILGVLAFNLGIESMQLIVVALIMPALISLSRTRFYKSFRIASALIAGIAAAGWITERLADTSLSPSSLAAWIRQHPIPSALIGNTTSATTADRIALLTGAMAFTGLLVWWLSCLSLSRFSTRRFLTQPSSLSAARYQPSAGSEK